jgi:hypothetical protein
MVHSLTYTLLNLGGVCSSISERTIHDYFEQYGLYVHVTTHHIAQTHPLAGLPVDQPTIDDFLLRRHEYPLYISRCSDCVCVVCPPASMDVYMVRLVGRLVSHTNHHTYMIQKPHEASPGR